MIKYKDLSSVTMFVGLPGSGKTTYASSLAKYCIKHNIKTYSNVPILGTMSYDWDCDFGNFQFEENSLIIMDEAGLTCDNRNWEKNFNKAKVQFLKLIRHYGCKLVVFSQTWNDCDIKIRSMVGKLYIVRQSIIPFCTVGIPIFRRIDVDEETHEFKELYYKDSLIFRLFTCKRIFRPFYYKMFDSWDCPILPEKTFEYYGKECLK